MPKVGKPRPKTTAIAFFSHSVKEDIERTNPGACDDAKEEFKTLCSGRWKAMKESAKAPFKRQAEADKQRYEREMASYSPPSPVKKGKKRSAKAPKDPNAPKKPLSGFFLFSGENRALVKAENPGMSIGEIAKELGHRWKTVSAEEKEKLKRQYQEANKRYKVVLEDYNNGKMASGHDKENDSDDDEDSD